MDHYIENKIEYEGVSISNIFESYRFLENFKRDVKYYFEYSVVDGETPEMVSYSFYDTTSYWWVITLFNEIVDPLFDWPLTYEEIEKYATKLAAGDPTLRANKISELQDENDEKRDIKILKREYIPVILEQIQSGL